MGFPILFCDSWVHNISGLQEQKKITDISGQLTLQVDKLLYRWTHYAVCYIGGQFMLQVDKLYT